ncbi:receptor-like protein EIX1 [Telopea speciosissima]|uniref:receptor-like protein EIX1 n=1 Tax=Telopea speciosissima TaxID=54955 RepID=UPI001CC5DA29|nr:receptor-like protein EIX1 [Telopea speciosissima]
MGGLSAMTSIRDQFLLLRLLLLFQLLLLDFVYLKSNIVGAAGLSSTTTLTVSSSSSSCIEGERQALLEFKAGLNDTTSGRLSSWIGGDCCRWRGVVCNNMTRHVIKLDLRNQPVYSELTSVDEYYDIDWEAAQKSSLGGKISPSLLKLKHLNYLDLSFNINFQETHIPKFLGSLHNLRYLNLSLSPFTGTIPLQLGNLSRLQYLHLGSSDGGDLTINNLQWLSGLSSSLRYLNMDYVRFTGKSSTGWIQAVTMLPSLSELHLSSCQLSNIPLSISSLHSYAANFTSLLVLELTLNNFSSSIIPPWISNITSLTVLDLSDTDIGGRIPKTLGNLCNLKRLDLSDCKINGGITEYVNSLSMCNSSSRLETLHLGYNYKVSGLIPSSIGNLSSLIELDLSATQLSGPIPTSIGNLSSLIELDLSATQLSGPIPATIRNLSSLRTLDLSNTQITGPIPMSIGGLSSLRTLHLSGTQITGPIPKSIGGLSSLRYLDLSYNQKLDATIPESIGELSELVVLMLTESSLKGVISEGHFKNVKSLKVLYIGSEVPNKPLVFKPSREWIPTFSLETIHMSDLQMGPNFPPWLATQKNLSGITLRNVGISDTIPDSVWNLCARQWIHTLDLSQNQIRGRVPNSLEFFSADTVDLSFNQINGSFPLWSNVSDLNLGTNLFTGQIPQNIGKVLGSGVYALDFSGNFLNGRIPSSICQLPRLTFLGLSNNSLGGELPNCWKDMNELAVLDLGNNNLSGKIPQSIGYLSSLRFLLLSSNNFRGKFPSSLQKCTSLLGLDLSRNGFTGNIPTWIGESLSALSIISLRFNFFTEEIPSQICNLSELHFLDLSHNNLSGLIPQCLGNLSYLESNEAYPTSGFYGEHMMVVTKGIELEYSSTLDLVNSIDLSYNHLWGKIPDGITRLVGLGTLNLSMNHLTGKIPEKIGDLRNLETLDLSTNQLSGEIPPTISSLTFLSHLNLSHNNLSGKIPLSNQIQTIIDADASSSIYSGNSGLCGLPLPNNCPGTNISPPAYDEAKVDGDHQNEEWMDMLCGWVKLNTDGCSLGNPGRAGARGILRDDRAVLISAFSVSLGIKTNYVAEFMALLHGLLRAKEMYVTRLWIECDSMSVVDLIRAGSIPWFVRQQWLGLQPYLLSIFWKISHCFHEANPVADFLAKSAVNSGVSIPWVSDFLASVWSFFSDDAF